MRIKTKKLTLPPPRSLKLYIPTPKCQHTLKAVNRSNKQISRHVQMTPTKIQQYCKWVHSDTISKHTQIQEASLVQHDNTQHKACAAAGYFPKAISDLVTYLHAAAGYPVKQTWIRAIEQGHYMWWPGLTAEQVPHTQRRDSIESHA